MTAIALSILVLVKIIIVNYSLNRISKGEVIEERQGDLEVIEERQGDLEVIEEREGDLKVIEEREEVEGLGEIEVKVEVIMIKMKKVIGKIGV